MDRYIVDFYCKELKLVIEIDGASHFNPEAYLSDEKRQKVLENPGLTFLRFYDIDVKRNIENVIKSIEGYILDFREANGAS